MPTLTTAISSNAKGNAPAVIIPGAPATTLSYSQLSQQIASFQRQLAHFGISTGDAVSIALPNTLPFIVSFLAIAAQRAIAAPLNPAYKQAEFEFYIDDIKSKLVIVPRGAVAADAPAVKAARTFGAAVAEVWAEAGVVRLELPEGSEKPLAKAEEDDVALVLHTSGTTGRPKAVPLTHRNLTRTMGMSPVPRPPSAALLTPPFYVENIKNTYQLTPADRTYLVMPLFHVHGLLAGFLAPLASGGSVIVPPRFSAGVFWKDFVEYQATWYTAVPTIHQILLKSPLPKPLPKIRFIRSCSSPLSPTTFHALEAALQAPVLEAYAMTEAAHQMSSNPLPPAVRKPGTVGIGQGVEIRILDDKGDEVAQGKEGEICVRGENVTKGYINNPAANASSFTQHGFFRTGDQGKKDEDGYVIITGRIKELINRGGEKISPIEVDNAISAHPAVAEAVSFAVDSELYGQEVAAAVVRKDGLKVDEEELKKFVEQRLAGFKVPTKWYFTDVMPKTATGKIQRRIVAEAMQKKEKRKAKL
jgi:acyl-CoA synthetase (AMP-forming)/AMP-acid ligase II